MLGKNKELSPNLLNKVLDRFAGVEIAVIGDLIIDHYIWGKVERISPEAPVVVVHQTEEDCRCGGAGNVARNLLGLGAEVSISGVVGDDPYGKKFIELIEQEGADASGILVDPERPTSVKSRVIAHSQQVVRIDRESLIVIPEFLQVRLNSWLAEKVTKFKGFIISDYAKGVICPSLFDCIREQVKEGNGVTSKTPVLVDPKAPNFPLYSGIGIIKPNRKEAQEASGCIIKSRQDAIAAGRELLQLWNTEMLLITLGEMGMVVVTDSEPGSPPIEVETKSRHVYDVSGAGDTVSAVFLLSLAVGATPQQAAVLANYAAGIVVAEVGTVAITIDSLREAINQSI